MGLFETYMTARLREPPPLVYTHAYQGRVVSVLIVKSSGDLEHAVETLLQFVPITDGIVAQHQVQCCQRAMIIHHGLIHTQSH